MAGNSTPGFPTQSSLSPGSGLLILCYETTSEMNQLLVKWTNKQKAISNKYPTHGFNFQTNCELYFKNVRMLDLEGKSRLILPPVIMKHIK